MTNVTETLAERGGRYGKFSNHAQLSDNLQTQVEKHENWQWMPADAKQAIRIILDKIARAVNGDPNYTDNWHDIQGYAKLVEDRILHRGIYAKDRGSYAKGLDAVLAAQHSGSPNLSGAGRSAGG